MKNKKIIPRTITTFRRIILVLGVVLLIWFVIESYYISQGEFTITKQVCEENSTYNSTISCEGNKTLYFEDYSLASFDSSECVPTYAIIQKTDKIKSICHEENVNSVFINDKLSIPANHLTTDELDKIADCVDEDFLSVKKSCEERNIPRCVVPPCHKWQLNTSEGNYTIYEK